VGFFDRFKRQQPGAVPSAGASARGAGEAGFAVFDVETTGLSARSDRVLELAVVRTDASGVVVDEWVQRFNPEGPVGATHIHGITAADVAGAPRFLDLVPEVTNRMRGAVAVAHNAKFDLAFLRAEYTRAGWSLPWLPSLCTLDASSHYLPGMDRRRLADCCHAAGVRLRGEHSALGDARATAELLAFYLHPKRGPGPHPEHLGLLKHISTVQWPTAPSRPPRAPNPTTHTVRRIAATIAKPPPPALVSLLADFSLVDALDEGAPSSTLSYLEMLAEAMEDGVLTQDELSALSELATTLELSPEDVESANTALLIALAHLAVDDGKVTRAEREELIGISAALGVSETLVRTVLDDADRARTARLSAGLGPLPEGWKLGTPLRVGDKVAFTGGDEQVRSALQAEATRLGVRVMSSISSKTALLVSDGDFEGTKAATARALGLRVATSDEFAVLLRHLQPARERIRKTVPARVPRSDDGEPSVPAQGLAADLRRADPAVVRQWARENGYAVGTRGRLPAEVFAAHAAAVHARSGG
jgi:DNA polymerase-3 subunit epsilon